MVLNKLMLFEGLLNKTVSLKSKRPLPSSVTLPLPPKRSPLGLPEVGDEEGNGAGRVKEHPMPPSLLPVPD